MKIEKIYDFDVVKNTSLVGYIRATQNELESTFGTPTSEIDPSSLSDDGKVNVEWMLTIDGDPITIYDYKQSQKDRDKEVLWHIGGEDFGAVLKMHACGWEKAVTHPEFVDRLENPYGYVGA